MDMDVVARQLLRAVRGKRSQVAFARKLGYRGNPIADWEARQQVARWLSATTEPRLPDFLDLVDSITGRLCDLVAELVPIDQVPSLKADYEQRLAARRLAHEEPWTEAILRVMETNTYRAHESHPEGFIARELGIGHDTEARCLEKLEAAGVLVKRDARYEPLRSLTVDTRAIPQLEAHWCRVAEQRLPAPRTDDVFCYNVLSASKADIERIRQLMLATFREIRSIVEHTPKDEAVALVNLQMVQWPPE